MSEDEGLVEYHIDILERSGRSDRMQDVGDEAPRRHERPDQDVEEAEAVREVRRARDRALSPSERIERLHLMCASAVAFERAARRGAS